MAEKIDRYPCS